MTRGVPNRLRAGLPRYPSKAAQDAKADRNLAMMEPILAAAEARGWLPCGDLLPNAGRRNNFFKSLPAEQRLALSAVIDEESGCWLWVGSMKGNGYGQFSYRGVNTQAHRASYQLHRGRIPDSLTIDHLCLNKQCVNPAHLEVVTPAENTHRWSATITACPQGHPYDEANTMRKAGDPHKRVCRACHNDRTSLRTAQRYTRAASATGRTVVRLGDEDIVEMKRLRGTGMAVKAIAAQFGVTAKYASAVIAGSRKRRGRHTGPGALALRVIAARSEGRCEFTECATAAAHTHHRRPRRLGSTRRPETNLPANLLRLCPDHHEWVESNRRDALARGLLLHDGDLPAAVPCETRHGRVLLADDGTWTEAS